MVNLGKDFLTQSRQGQGRPKSRPARAPAGFAVAGGCCMLRVGRYHFKLAETVSEFEQIHRLNYRIFVRETPQQPDPGNGTLVDKFHEKSTYILAMRDDQIVGMLSTNGQPPFSITPRLADPSVIHRPGMKPLEVRQLAMEPNERNTVALTGLVYSLHVYARAHGYTHFVISGVTEQLELYKHIGFEALGPPVGKPGAQFVPMMVTLDQVETKMQRTMMLLERRSQREAPTSAEPISMLPGPVPLAPEVRSAFAEPPI